jgi:hypothetical protein
MRYWKHASSIVRSLWLIEFNFGDSRCSKNRTEEEAEEAGEFERG